MTGLSLVALRNDLPSPLPDLSLVQALLDLLTDGSKLAPSLGEPEAILLLCELGGAVADLRAGQRARAVVRLCVAPDPWEIGLERSGREVLISIFQGGVAPEVLVFERRLPGDVLVERVREALSAFVKGPSFAARGCENDVFDSDDAAASLPSADGSTDARIEAVRERLSRSASFGDAAPIEPEVVTVEPTGELPIVIAADALLRSLPPTAGPPPSVLRSDLFSLLFRGRMKIALGDHVRELPEDVFVFLVAEQLARLSLEAVEAWTRGRPYYRRVTAFGAICGVKLVREGGASLTLGIPRRSHSLRADPWTFPAVDVAALAQGVVSFGRALLRSLIRRDRAQASNLRLHEFRATLRELSERLRDATRNDSKINDAPESYRAFAAASRARTASAAFSRTRLLFTSRWIAAVPSIDLRATFLCGDRLLIGASHEIICLDARTGEPLFRTPAPRAVSVMTPLGLARLLPDGSLRLHDLASGDVIWSTRLSPRVGSSASGAIVSAPGLPRMLIVSEGARHLTAVDLDAGEVRWRFAARRGGVFRLRRAGKLVIVTSGDPTLSALDVRSGEVVWRFCDRLRFSAPVAVDHDALFAMAGDAAVVGRGGTRLYHIDPWSGVVRWGVDLPPHVAPVGAPLIGPDTVVLATHGRRGTGLVGLDRRTGELRFEQAVTASAASCLMVDGTVIVNSEGGEVVGVSASDGTTRYRHVFASGAEGDRPRRLEPVLRSGALFVPQSEVHVVRPHDGTLLGRIQVDVIPDLLRVDERCDVYVAEESGHVAAYSAAPRLSVVRGLG